MPISADKGVIPKGYSFLNAIWGESIMAKRYYVTDTDLSTRFPIYTRANVGEVFPDPVTPLTADTALWLAELGWRVAWVRMGSFELMVQYCFKVKFDSLDEFDTRIYFHETSCLALDS